MKNNTIIIIKDGKIRKGMRFGKFFVLFFVLLSFVILSDVFVFAQQAGSYESLLRSEIKPNVLIVFSGDFNYMENYLNSKDIIPMHIFPSEGSSAIIAYQPAYVQDDLIFENDDFVQIFHDYVNVEKMQEYGEGVVYAVVAFDNFIGRPVVGSVGSGIANPSFAQTDDLIIPSDYEFAVGRAGIDIGPNGGPTSQETSLFMIGKSSVTVVLPESNGSIDPNTENWNATEVNQVVQEVTEGTNWYIIREPRARLSFVYRFYQVQTSYEPINRPSIDECLWINQIAQQFGYYSGTSCSDNVRNANNAFRSQDNSDWGYTVFVVDSSNDLDGSFSNGQSAYAYLAGPFIVMTYDNGGWGINNMEKVTAHEMGHSFQALDQYLAQISNSPSCNPNNVNAQCTQTSGFLNIENQNCEIASCLINQPSIMKWHNVAYPNGTIDVYARGQLGWRDANNDNILDPIQRPYNSGSDADGDTITDYWDDCPNEFALQGFGCPTVPYFSWLNDTRITFNNTYSLESSIVTDSLGNVHIVWTDFRDANSCNSFTASCNSEIYYTKLDRFGNTLIDDLRLTYSDLSTTYVLSHKPVLAVDSQNNLHLVWQEGNVYPFPLKYSKLSNNGDILVNKTILSGSSYDTFPSIAVDNLGNVQVFASRWPVGTNSRITHTKLNDSGEVIVFPHNYVLSPPFYDDYSPSIAIDNQNNIHMVWTPYDYAGSNGAHVQYAKFDQLGNFITSMNISPISSDYFVPLYVQPPRIKTDSLGKVHIVWSSVAPSLSTNVYYAQLNNGGNFMLNTSRLTSNYNNYPSSSNISYAPSIALDGQDNINIAWWFGRSSYAYPVVGNNYSLYYIKKNQNLADLVSLSALTSFNFPYPSSFYPSLPSSIFTDSLGNVHFSFSKVISAGNNEIYYKRSFSQPSIFLEGIPSPGSLIKFHIVDALHPGAPYFFALAFGTSPGLSLPDGRVIPLNYDNLMLLSLNNPGSFGLSNNIGYLNNNGYANVTLAIPNGPSLTGQTFYAGFITVNNPVTQVLGISPAMNVTIV